MFSSRDGLSYTYDVSLGIGIIGCGNISGIYFQNCVRFQNLRLAACADLISDRALQASDQFGIPALPLEAIYEHPEIDLILNLTVPLAHSEVTARALKAGKHVYSEKPFAVDREDGKVLMQMARERGLSLGSAPDTFLGAGLQTCRELIDQGAIGQPVSATAFMTCHGHEGWHPNPEFYYLPGGGPMLDMGPYYLTALVHLLGPIRCVAGMASAAFTERTVGSGEKQGTAFPVQVDTHVAGTLQFESGAIASVITSFDIWAANLPCLEVHGTEGSLSVPDPNTFGGPIRLFRPAEGWTEVPLTHPFAENSRALGLADMADALQHRRDIRASGSLALHVLDAMQAFGDSSSSGSFTSIQCKTTQPAPLAVGEAEGWVR